MAQPQHINQNLDYVERRGTLTYIQANGEPKQITGWFRLSNTGQYVEYRKIGGRNRASLVNATAVVSFGTPNGRAIADLGLITHYKDHSDGTVDFEVTPVRNDGTTLDMEQDLLGHFFRYQEQTWRITYAYRAINYLHPHGKHVYIVTAKKIAK